MLCALNRLYGYYRCLSMPVNTLNSNAIMLSTNIDQLCLGHNEILAAYPPHATATERKVRHMTRIEGSLKGDLLVEKFPLSPA